ncbi:hypothetical protein COCMIDRAFT_92708 [Bipolaris oryzae ATCC 44560]|uniref:NACHT-NTPase and P-loop NTPases N-terminal domain-containing protein n=1 Tax=Bipolaris oryzae ATCC 44560 TaxID=930090 RepID=W6ZG55_COCMI|nr:uncharacterized protein COCMIDRAFT_92708 [Bipolaris oryzae ATCC 44560]EUC46494.1 hypothetical protein COCMIDRAFT_92708 [Bipolaris oryzae ATCC 44560]
MTGVGEASAIIGIVSAVITFIDAAKKVYDAAENAGDLPAAFREVAQRLPLIQDTLKIIEAQLEKDKLDKATYEAIKSTSERAKTKAEQLKVIFEKCIPVEGASRYARYVAALRTLGKEHKVEVLMKDLLGAVQDIANGQTMRTATREQIIKLSEALDAVLAVEPSVPDEFIEGASAASRNVHMGQGDMYSADGQAEQFNAKDNARQYKAETMNFGKD